MDSGADLTFINQSDHNPLLEAITWGNKEVILAWSMGIASGCLETWLWGRSLGRRKSPSSSLLSAPQDSSLRSSNFFRWLLTFFFDRIYQTFSSTERDPVLEDRQPDVFCHVSAILVVVNMDSCSLDTGLRRPWQWELGDFTLTVTWLNLLSPCGIRDHR